jgi:glycosyltransferase involved in cell wall biosynthesis
VFEDDSNMTMSSDLNPPAAASAASAGQRLRVALIMPALNEQEAVDPTLAAVFASSRLPDEIVVADARSIDATRERLQAWVDRGVALRVVDNPGIYAGAGRNAAVLESSADLLLFLDFGNLVEPGWIAAMADAFEGDPDVEAVGGLYEPWVIGPFDALVAALQYQDALQFNRLTPTQQRAALPSRIRLGGLGIGIRRETYLALGGMPDWLRAAEDLLFGHKLELSRRRVVPVLGARLRHHLRATPSALYSQNATYSRGEARVGHGAGRHARLALVYLFALAGLAATPWTPGLTLAALAPLVGKVWRQGWVRVRRTWPDRDVRFDWRIRLQVVFSKDLGSLVGYGQGLIEWVFQRHWQYRCRDYLAKRGTECAPGDRSARPASASASANPALK